METAPYTLHRIHLGNVSCFLIFREGEAVLVDCGNHGSQKAIHEALQQLNLEPDMVRLLILTHVHYDHAGSAKVLKEQTGCRIVVHRSEAERLRSGLTPVPGGTRWKAKILTTLGKAFRRRIMRFPGAEPDILAEDELDLSPYGFPARLMHTPGHTPGSMVVWLEGGELLAGDTFFGLEGRLHFPPFAENTSLLLKSWEQLRSLPAATIYPAHGHPFAFSRFLEEYEGAVGRYSL